MLRKCLHYDRFAWDRHRRAETRRIFEKELPSRQWTVSQPAADMRTEVSWKRRFLRKRLKYMVVCVLVVAVIFVMHQLFYFKELNRATVGKLIAGSLKDTHRVIVGNRDTSKWQQPQHSKLIRDKNGRTVSLRGSRDQDVTKYLPNANGKFACFTEKTEIDFTRINDDYCDCPADGSDEPGTNACNNGFFYCEKSSKQSTGIITVSCVYFCNCMKCSFWEDLNFMKSACKITVKVPSYKINDGFCDCCDGSDEWADVPVLYKLSGNFLNMII